MENVRPISGTWAIITVWILLAFLYMLIAPDEGSEKTFAILVYAFYLAPVVGILSFSIFWVTNKLWFSEHKGIGCHILFSATCVVIFRSILSQRFIILKLCRMAFFGAALTMLPQLIRVL